MFFTVEVTRRQNEGVESLFRRFSRKVQQSGVLLQARKVRFFAKKKNQTKRRDEAKRRGELQAERARMIKMGEIDEFTPLHKKPRR